MYWPIRFILSMASFAPRGERWTCSCYWCDHSHQSRTYGVAWARMVVHFARCDSEVPLDPDTIPGDIQDEVYREVYPTLPGLPTFQGGDD